MSSASDKLSGKAKEATGKATGNDRLRAEGKIESTRGKIKDKFNNATSKLADKLDDTTK